jgi:hypothetical protein
MMLTEDVPKTLTEFNKRFATEEACREHLRAVKWPNGPLERGALARISGARSFSPHSGARGSSPHSGARSLSAVDAGVITA